MIRRPVLDRDLHLPKSQVIPEPVSLIRMIRRPLLDRDLHRQKPQVILAPDLLRRRPVRPSLEQVLRLRLTQVFQICLRPIGQPATWQRSTVFYPEDR
jgi:hypothetical protein